MNIKFRYYLYHDKQTHYIVLLDRLEGRIVHKSIGFKDMYFYILGSKILYKDIKLKDYTYYGLFYDFVDESSINNEVKKGDRI